MWKKILVGLVIFSLLGVGIALAQDDGQPKPKPKYPKPMDDDNGGEMSPEDFVKELNEVVELMKLAADWLNESSKGKSLEAQKEILKKIEKILKEEFKDYDPSKLQEKILEKIEKLLKATEGKQKTTIDKLTKLIKEAQKQEQKQQKQGKGEGEPKPGEKQEGQPKSTKQPGNPATKPYDPSKVDPPNPFKSDPSAGGLWGQLPPKVRDMIEAGERSIEKFPAEYHEILREYFKKISESR